MQFYNQNLDIIYPIESNIEEITNSDVTETINNSSTYNISIPVQTISKIIITTTQDASMGTPSFTLNGVSISNELIDIYYEDGVVYNNNNLL